MGLSVPVLGMVKDDKHRTRGLCHDGRVMELRENRSLFRHVGLMQEETHRFAIEYHRGLRGRRLEHSALDEIPGIGEKRRNRLLTVFGSMAAVAAASEEELRARGGLTPALAKAVKEHLQRPGAEDKIEAGNTRSE
jgi:excinuclease ABC subunit C